MRKKTRMDRVVCDSSRFSRRTVIPLVVDATLLTEVEHLPHPLRQKFFVVSVSVENAVAPLSTVCVISVTVRGRGLHALVQEGVHRKRCSAYAGYYDCRRRRCMNWKMSFIAATFAAF